MKIAFITSFPPSRHALNEYGFHVADQLRQEKSVELTVLGDYLPAPADELPGFNVSFSGQSNCGAGFFGTFQPKCFPTLQQERTSIVLIVFYPELHAVSSMSSNSVKDFRDNSVLAILREQPSFIAIEA